MDSTALPLKSLYSSGTSMLILIAVPRLASKLTLLGTPLISNSDLAPTFLSSSSACILDRGNEAAYRAIASISEMLPVVSVTSNTISKSISDWTPNGNPWSVTKASIP